MMFRLKYLKFAILTLTSVGMSSVYAATLQHMSDEQMSEMTGQALMSLSYIAPNDAANLETKRNQTSNIGFYKLGLEAELELNANIKKLQLGCGGVNGAGLCDIDIDNLGLSGLGNSKTSNTESASDRQARVESSAVLTNPFIQFAIKNPDSASTREIVGINLSSEKALGLITFGTDNSDAVGAVHTGINRLSGYMQVAKTGGIAKVNGYGNGKSDEAAKAKLTQTYTGVAIKGTASGVGFTTKSYNLNLTDAATGSNILQGNLSLPQQEITGKRINQAVLKASATVNDIAISGNIVANALLIINLDRQTSGTIKNLAVDATITEGLNYFHKASLNGTPVSLSLQSQDLKWAGNNSVSQKGWWLEFSNPIDIGDITPSLPVDIEKSTIQNAMGQINNFLAKKENEINCGSWGILNCLFGDSIAVGTVDLTGAAPSLMPLNNLVLKNQNFTPNCYGELKFC